MALKRMPKDIKSLIPTELVEEYAEVGVDKLVEESKAFIPLLDQLGNEIPYIKTLVAAIKFPRTLSDFLLGKKVSAFLFSCDISKEKIDKFKNKFSTAKQERLWEQVVFSINNHDDKIKSEILGKLFLALIEENISEEEFNVMVHATNSININSLESLKELYMLGENSPEFTSSLLYSFISLGLVDIDNSLIGTWGGGGPAYPPNQIGWKYIGIVYNHPPSSIEGVKIGEEILVNVLGDDGREVGKPLPYSQVKAKGLKHRVLQILMVNKSDEILCSQQTKLPFVVEERVIASRESAPLAANKITKQYGSKAFSVLMFNDADANQQKWMFVLKADEPLEGTLFMSVNQINKQLALLSSSESKRLFSETIEQIRRHTVGDLQEFWNK